LMYASDRSSYVAEDEVAGYPHPLESMSWHSEYIGLKPYNIEIVPVDSQDEVENFGTQRHTLDVFLRALKPRTVDPLYRDSNGDIVRLTDSDEQAKKLLAECREIQKQAYVARYHGDPAFLDGLKAKIEDTRTEWVAMLQTERADKNKMSALIRDAGMFAVTSSGIRMRYY
jgi:hypothetical protein